MQGGLKPMWFTHHLAIQTLAVLTALASLIMIFVQRGTTVRSYEVWRAHQVLGSMAMGECLADV